MAPDCWLLKGALALDFRLGAQVRATQDMDLAHAYDADAATADLVAAQAQPIEVPQPPADRQRPYAVLAKSVGLDLDVKVGHSRVAAFLDPLLRPSPLTNARWDPSRQCWETLADYPTPEQLIAFRPSAKVATRVYALGAQPNRCVANNPY